MAQAPGTIRGPDHGTLGLADALTFGGRQPETTGPAHPGPGRPGHPDQENEDEEKGDQADQEGYHDSLSG